MFHYYTKLGAKLVEPVQLMHKFVPWTHIIIFGSERTRSTPLDRELLFCAFHSVWVHFGLYHYWTKLDAKWAEMVELMHRFVAWSRIGIFRNERTRSTPLDPKLMFWCVSYRLRGFGTVMLPYKTRGKTFRTSAKVRATMLRRIISQWTHPIQPIGS